ncbi:basic proline-rich protein-like [Oenanthe melanoleuca]|uniref:basic proline-rich protein-like n=1 Tax=Oenanthe melanoleuca TaxID=2939378 RepID=UPI0024C0E8BE|nr:basic proline-rich protein-like [Oenanthe melanoleuca]
MRGLPRGGSGPAGPALPGSGRGWAAPPEQPPPRPGTASVPAAASRPCLPPRPELLGPRGPAQPGPLHWLPGGALRRRAAMETPGPPPTCAAAPRPPLCWPARTELRGEKSKVICWNYIENERWVDPILRRAEELPIAKGDI